MAALSREGTIHDRAGFGGGLATIGVLITLLALYARPSRPFHEAIVLAGLAGFGCAIGTHFAEGYLNPVHLAPAFAGLALFLTSICCEIAGWPVEQGGPPYREKLAASFFLPWRSLSAKVWP